VKYRQGELDIQFADYRNAHIRELLSSEAPYFVTPGDMEAAHNPLKVQKVDEAKQEEFQPLQDDGDYTSGQAIVCREEHRSTLTGKMEIVIRDPFDGTFLVKAGDTDKHSSMATNSPQDPMLKSPAEPEPKIATSSLDNWLREEILHREQRQSSLTGKMEISIRDPMDGTFIVKIENPEEEENSMPAATSSPGNEKKPRSTNEPERSEALAECIRPNFKVDGEDGTEV
jgi:hypothetical protein